MCSSDLPRSLCMESISAIRFLIRSIYLYLFPFTFCLYMTYLFLTRSPLCSFVSPHPYVSASIPDPYVQPSSSRLAYISPVCLCSSNIKHALHFLPGDNLPYNFPELFYFQALPSTDPQKPSHIFPQLTDIFRAPSKLVTHVTSQA